MTSDAAIAASADLRDAYRAVWRLILAEQQRILSDPRRQARRDRLTLFRRIVEAELRDLDDLTARWVKEVMPGIYELGAGAAALDVGVDFGWTTYHREAFAKHAGDVYDDLLRATRYVRRDVKAFIRKAARLRALRATLDDTAARQAAALAKDLERNGIAAITYRNGARHGLEEYAEAVLRTKTAVAYNDGTLNFAGEFGVKYFEVFDGPDCGWRFHYDGETALGKIVTIDDARGNPIAHPNCRRAFGARPDLLTPADALAARGGQVTTSQTRAQRAADAARREALARRRARRRRVSAGR